MSVIVIRMSLLASVIVLWPSHTNGQDSAPPTGSEVAAVIGGIISYHPPAFDGHSNGPYLDRALGGTVPGVSVAASFTSDAGAHLTLEASSTTLLKRMQAGRFVTGSGPTMPALATYRDTMVSVLSGVNLRVSQSGTAFEPKVGFSLLLGSAHRANDDSGGSAALTAGLDGIVPVNTRLAFVPSLRYSYVFRGDSSLEFGLSSHVVKAGFGLRFRVSP